MKKKPKKEPEFVPAAIEIKRVQMVCPDCGSTNVTRSADAQWSVEDQRWELQTTYDECNCVECGETKRFLSEALLNDNIKKVVAENEALRKDWKYEVLNGDTYLGYHEWLQHRKEAGE